MTKSGILKGEIIAICLLWVIDHNSHVSYGSTQYYVRKLNIITDNPKCTGIPVSKKCIEVTILLKLCLVSFITIYSNLQLNRYW